MAMTMTKIIIFEDGSNNPSTSNSWPRPNKVASQRVAWSEATVELVRKKQRLLRDLAAAHGDGALLWRNRLTAEAKQAQKAAKDAVREERRRQAEAQADQAEEDAARGDLRVLHIKVKRLALASRAAIQMVRQCDAMRARVPWPSSSTAKKHPWARSLHRCCEQWMSQGRPSLSTRTRSGARSAGCPTTRPAWKSSTKHGVDGAAR